MGVRVRRLPRDADPPGRADAAPGRRWRASTLALPVDFEDRKLVVAFAEPADDDAVAAVGAATGYEIIPAVADRDELARRDRHDLRRRDRTRRAGVADGRDRSAKPATTPEDELHINDLLELVIE